MRRATSFNDSLTASAIFVYFWMSEAVTFGLYFRGWCLTTSDRRVTTVARWGTAECSLWEHCMHVGQSQVRGKNCATPPPHGVHYRKKPRRKESAALEVTEKLSTTGWSLWRTTDKVSSGCFAPDSFFHRSQGQIWSKVSEVRQLWDFYKDIYIFICTDLNRNASHLNLTFVPDFITGSWSTLMRDKRYKQLHTDRGFYHLGTFHIDVIPHLPTCLTLTITNISLFLKLALTLIWPILNFELNHDHQKYPFNQWGPARCPHEDSGL